MGIDKNNYEAHLLDLWEGNLSEEDKVLLYQFLEDHPELDDGESLNLLEDIFIPDNNINFDKASINFNQINLQNHEFFFVAYVEGDLSKEEMTAVDEFLNVHPILIEKFTQFKKTKLPTEAIQYPHKEKLIFGKAPIFSMPARRRLIVAVAASIALVIWTSAPFQNSDYKYTLNPTEKKDVNQENPDTLVDDTQKREINPIRIEVENRPAVERHFSPSDKEKESKEDELKDENLNKLSPADTENQTFLTDQKEEGNEMKEKESNSLSSGHASNALASNVPSENIEVQETAYISPYVKEEIPTFIDLTASYLQRKNILDNDRKVDFQGILNSTFANVNHNKKPVIDFSEDTDKKTVFFQFGNLIVERKTTK
ncbi:MAG: hypothetical protein PHQ74_01480 [Crocinitomicaceae bacterium]|nr:hypothetical protein [Crocinitomicaceae bacterium]